MKNRNSLLTLVALGFLTCSVTSILIDNVVFLQTQLELSSRYKLHILLNVTGGVSFLIYAVIFLHLLTQPQK